MIQTEHIEQLLKEIQELEARVADMRQGRHDPVSFFGTTVELSHRILQELHAMEKMELELMRQQVEAHQALIESIPSPIVTPQPEPQPEQHMAEPVIEPEQPIIEEPHTPATTERSGLYFNELFEKQNLSDFRKAFSLNDRFRFRRELFGGDEELMNQVINDLNGLHSLADSLHYLQHRFAWNNEEETVKDFIQLLEKRFL